MPRTASTIDDPQITLRLKYGVHTIFLFAMLDWSFSHLTVELLSILRDRYRDGLTVSASIDSPERTPLPASDDDVTVAYAVPENPNDLSQGWKDLKANPDDTLSQKGLTDTCAVAFTLLDPEADGEKVEFRVELPSMEGEEL